MGKSIERVVTGAFVTVGMAVILAPVALLCLLFGGEAEGAEVAKRGRETD